MDAPVHEEIYQGHTIKIYHDCDAEIGTISGH